MTRPELTVVMPVFNGERYLNEAIDSVLNQTFSDFELIIINDASTDRSLEIIKSYSDGRIRILNNPKNKGIPYNRNLGLHEAKGEFLCWTDCDDVNLPERFKKQLDFLKKNPQFGGCGTWLSRFKGDKTYYVNRALKDPEEIKASLLFRPATIPNATVMLRLDLIRKHNIRYNENLPISEDYDFVLRCSRIFDFTNIPEVLYKYRDSETSIMKKFENKAQKRSELHENAFKLAIEELGLKPTDTDLWIHESICSQRIFDNFSEFEACYSWFKKLESANLKAKIYKQKLLKKVMGEQFFFVAKKASKFGMKTLYYYVQKSRKNGWEIKIKDALKLTVRCFLRHDKFEFKRF